MKRLIAALVTIGLGVTASGGLAGASQTQGPGSSGNGAATHYALTFTGFYIAPGIAWNGTCDGNRIVNKGGGTKDVETCTISGDTSTIVAGTYKSTGIAPPSLGYCVGYAVGSVPFVFGGALACWASDDDGQLASSWQQTFTPVASSPGEWTLAVVAYYNT